MSVRRVVMRLLGRYDVTSRNFLLVMTCLLSALVITLQISSRVSPDLELQLIPYDKSSIREIRKLWSVDKPLVETNYSGKVIVVEEHHEVLQYWLQDSNLPRKGNVLVHIDGHSDGSPVANAPNFPWFTWPKNTQELRVLMQENDVFIAGAAMSGLISRVVYVWPIWDERNHSRKYESNEIAIGWYIPDPKVSDKPREFCMCEMDDSELGSDGMHCESAMRGEGRTQAEATAEDDDEPFIPVNISDCHIMTRFHWEEVWDQGALARLVRGGWFTPSDNIILDIDEDFFGCEAADTRFKEVGLEWNTIQVLSHVLDQLFCARDVTLERFIDTFLRDVIDTVMAATDRKSTDVRRKFRRMALKQYEKLVRSRKKIFCKFDNDRKVLTSKGQASLFMEAVNTLLDMSSEQLRLVRKVGFCFSFSTVTYIDESPESMPHIGVCAGSTGPDNHYITHHVPTHQEIVRQSDKLNDILSLLPQPKHVTVCRSFRDGYVPKDFWPQIEKSILDSVRNSYPAYDSVHYDSRLLGGPKGWFARLDK